MAEKIPKLIVTDAVTKEPVYIQRGKKVFLRMKANGRNYEVTFDKKTFMIQEIHFWNDGDLVKGFGDPNYLVEEVIQGPKFLALNKAIEMFQAEEKLRRGMELDFLKPEDVKPVKLEKGD